MTPTHATKPGKRYRYYNTKPDLLDGTSAWRVSAHDLEQLVCTRIAGMLVDQQAVLGLVPDCDASLAQRVLAEADLAAARLRSGTAHTKASILESLRPNIQLRSDAVDIRLERARLGDTLGVALDSGDEDIELTCAATRVRSGHQLRLVIPGPEAAFAVPAMRDAKLVALLAEAHAARTLVLASPKRSISAIAAHAGRCRTHLARLLPIACLAPDIVPAIVEGPQPPSMTARSLLGTELPLAWCDQRTALGFS